MMNMKSLFAVMAMVSLLLVAVGLVRFSIDLWGHFHTVGPNSNTQVNYRGLGEVLGGLVMFVVFVLLYRWRKA